MVSSCSALGCKERAVRGNHVTFHRFPLNPLLKEKWIKAVRRKDYVPTKNARICEKHFTPDCYVKVKSGRKILKDNAVPQVFDFSPYIKKKYKKLLDLEIETKNLITNDLTESIENVSNAHTSVASVISLDNGCLNEAKKISSVTFVTIKPSNFVTDYSFVGVENITADSSYDSDSTIQEPENPELPMEVENNDNDHKEITDRILPKKDLYKNCSRLRYLGDFKSEHLSSFSCRMNFISKLRSMAVKFIERFRIAKIVNQKFQKRKMFLESLLIRIKEADAISDMNTSDLIDCFLAEENDDMIDNKYTPFSDDLEYCNEFIDLHHYCLEQNILSLDNTFDSFGMYVASILRSMSSEEVALYKKTIEEIINKYTS